MDKIKRLCWLTSALFFTLTPAASSQVQLPHPPILVGRISHIEGQLLRFVPAEQDWVTAVKDAPFGMEDSLYSNQEGKAEFILPNGTWARINGNTQIQLLALRGDLTQVDIASGTARFHNKGSQGAIKATTPFGYVWALPQTSFDLYVGDSSLEVVALQGRVSFVPAGEQARYEVAAGSSSILADLKQVTAGDGIPDPDWNSWNLERDALWAQRLEVNGESMAYLPPSLCDQAYLLEEHGRWEMAYYEGGYRYLWRPIHVGLGWTPFTAGRWTVWYDDHCWIPDEPFGYLTHHYGDWVFIDGVWYWVPPEIPLEVGRGPFLDYGWAWSPGRVFWIYSGGDIGWVPLAPFEPYYCYRPWGPRVVVVDNILQVNLFVNRYRYIHHAVIVHQNNLYRVNNYRRLRVTNINHATLLNDYRAAPMISQTVIKNYNSLRQRYYFVNEEPTRKPHQIVVDRIRKNDLLALEAKAEKGSLIKQKVASLPQGTPSSKIEIEAPAISDRLVPAGDVAKPKAEIEFPRRELKRRVAAQKVTPSPEAPVQIAPVEGPETGGPGISEPPAPPPAGEPKIKPSKPKKPQPAKSAKPRTGEKRKRPAKSRQVQPEQPGSTKLTPPPPTSKPGVKPPKPRPVQPGQPGQ